MEEQLSKIVHPLQQWYLSNKRELPWRIDREPYHVWISEIMLQQTRVEAVKNYYTRFITALPDTESLSQCSEEELLKLWEGLGYYTRARNMKKAAQQIVEHFQGKFPQSYEEIIQLAGIGEYTAGAIASICFQEKVTAVDGNVLRVVSRITESYQDVLLPETKKETTRLLLSVMPEQSGDFNEALMELGELICLPNGEPLCEQCPIHHECLAYRHGTVGLLPVRVKKLQKKHQHKTVFLIHSQDGKVAIEKRPDTGLLSGMYQFPNTDGELTAEEATVYLKKHGLLADEITPYKKVKHIFTHIVWEMCSYQIKTSQSNQEYLWVTPKALKDLYPLPTAFQLFLKNKQDIFN